jgi:SAM-dependent methyltransferase
MRIFRECLHLPSCTDIRAAVLEDLSRYSGFNPEECVRRCLDWEGCSVQEWFSADRSDPASVNEFYRTTQSWVFDLLWYAYLQAEGYAEPTSVIALRLAGADGRGRNHLDYGSGVGVTSQVFAGAEYQTTLADVSDSLLSFATFRLERRGLVARYVNLNDKALEPASYDVVTAIDTFACIDDVSAVATNLHTALRPGGCLIANLSPRPRSRDIAWAVHEDTTGPRAAIARAGFLPTAREGSFSVYRRVDPATSTQRLRVLRDRVILTSRARRVLHQQNMRFAAALRGQPLAAAERQQ